MKIGSDCSGPCHTCTASGGCIAGHGDDHYERIGKAEAVRRLSLRRTDGGRHYNKSELVELSVIAGTACPDVISNEAMVSIIDLKVIAGIGCEYVIRGAASCDEADGLRGGCCNACWAVRWAKGVLKKAGWDD